MILTDRFVYIHMPKTGGTFVTSVLEKLHAPKHTFLQELLRRCELKFGLPVTEFHNSRYGMIQNVEPKHGTCHDVPKSHANLPIISCMRGPYEWYVSQYEFSWWKRTVDYDPDGPPTPAGWAIEQALPAFRASCPHFPEIGFSEFMTLCNQAADIYNNESGRDFGLYTHGFVRYYYRDPKAVLDQLSDAYISSEEHLADRFDVVFIKTEQLNAEVRKVLREFGYREDDLTFIHQLGRILPMGLGRSEEQKWESYYTPELKAVVRERDRNLFAMFPVYDGFLG